MSSTTFFASPNTIMVNQLARSLDTLTHSDMLEQEGALGVLYSANRMQQGRSSRPCWIDTRNPRYSIAFTMSSTTFFRSYSLMSVAAQAFSAASTSSSIFLASPKSMRLLSL